MNLSNIPNNILKIIEPILKELKEDKQTLNQDEFIKAMNKLFANISSTERRELVSEYNYIKTKSINKDISMKNTSKNKTKKNFCLKKVVDNDFNFYNISNINNNKKLKQIHLIYNDNNFENNYLSSRPKTPIYRITTKNNMDNKIIKKQKENSKENENNNTNMLAYKHYLKTQKMMKNLKNINNNDLLYNNKLDGSCFDKFICNRNQRNYTKNSMAHKNLFLNENIKFNSINDYTYNNYLKDLS